MTSFLLFVLFRNILTMLLFLRYIRKMKRDKNRKGFFVNNRSFLFDRIFMNKTPQKHWSNSLQSKFDEYYFFIYWKLSKVSLEQVLTSKKIKLKKCQKCTFTTFSDIILRTIPYLLGISFVCQNIKILSLYIKLHVCVCVICVTVSHKMWQTDTERSDELEHMGTECPDVLVDI